MDIKLIAMDMDGTLLKSDNTISDRTKQTLINAQKQGIRLVLASGRSYRKLMEYAKELEMDQYGGYLIEVNGIALYDLARDEREVFTRITKEEGIRIFDVLKPMELEIQALMDDGLYDYIPASMMEEKRAYRKRHHMGDDYPWTAGAFTFVNDNRKGYPRQFTFSSGEDLQEEVNKFAACHHEDVLRKWIPAIKEQLGNDFWIGLTSPCWLEIMPKGITKGSALTALAKELDVSMEQVMAFGDGENDIEMLTAVKYGIVMENALANVKKVAYTICDDNNHDGIAKVVEEMILSKTDAN